MSQDESTASSSSAGRVISRKEREAALKRMSYEKTRWSLLNNQSFFLTGVKNNMLLGIALAETIAATMFLFYHAYNDEAGPSFQLSCALASVIIGLIVAAGIEHDKPASRSRP